MKGTVPFWQREYFSTRYKIAFLNAISLRLQAGESAGRALAGVIRGERNPNKQRDLMPGLRSLEQGETVAASMTQLGLFDSTVLAILRAGERSGMRNAITAAAAHLGVKHAWFRQHALVIFILANEMLSALFAPVVLYRDVLPWIRENVTPTASPEMRITFERDMLLAENLTIGLLALSLILVTLGTINLYQISRLRASTRVLMFFADGAMSVGFRLASAMLKAGVTIEDAARDLARQAPGWSRHYWLAVSGALDRAIEPAQAMLQAGLLVDERSLIASHANARQLAETLHVLAEDRAQRARRGRDTLLIGATILTVGYIFMCLGLAIWIYITYDSTLTAGLESLGSF